MIGGHSIKLALGRIISSAVVAGGWVLVGIRTVLDLIGYSTAPEDAEIAQTRLEQFFAWVLSLPWWAVWGFALIATLWLMYVSWPRPTAATESKESEEGSRNLEFAELELFIDLENKIGREIGSINIFDATTLPIDDGVVVHIIFEQPLIDPSIGLKVDKKKDNFDFVVERSTSRFCAIRIDGIEPPCTLDFDIHSRNYNSKSL